MSGKLYRYAAVDEQGEPIVGTMEETSAERVTQILTERGLQVNTVEADAVEAFSKKSGHRLTWSELAQFNEHLVAITRGKMPLAPSLKAIAHDLERGRLKSVVESVGNDLESGKSLEDALAANGAQFPSVYRSMIRAGERTGNLPGVLDMMAKHSTRMLDLKTQLVMTLTYPAIVLSVSVVIVGFLLVRVVPVFADIFQEFGAGLPAPTQILVDMSQFLEGNIESLIGAFAALVIVAIVGGIFFRTTTPGQYIIDEVFHWIPLIGRSYRATTLSRFSRSLGLMLKSEVPILESLDLAATSSGNLVLKKHVDAAAVQIARGEKMADAFSDTKYFPHAYCWFLANGENFGTLPDTLLTVSESYEQSVTNNDRLLITLIAPISVFVIAFAIGFIVFALYLPIFTLGDAMSG